MGNSSSAHLKRCGGHFGDWRGEEAEARLRPGGARAPVASELENGLGGPQPARDRAGLRRGRGLRLGGCLGERRGGDWRAVAVGRPPRRPQGPSSISFRFVFILVSGVQRALEAKGPRPELECATCVAGGGGWAAPGDLLAGAWLPHPPSQRLPLQGGLRVSSLSPSWAWLPPSSTTSVGKVAKSRPGLRPGEVGLALPGAPSDRQLNR